jgi:Undecaprenyl-phosphate glucose phosphotransferase
MREEVRVDLYKRVCVFRRVGSESTMNAVPQIQRHSSAEASTDSCPFGVAARLEYLLARIVAIEFLAVAAACYLASVVYFELFLSEWPSTVQYVASAFFIAGLVLIASFAFKHYAGIQAQPRDRFMWSGLGVVVLAFSLFLSLLFVFKIADWYSRGTFFFQFFGAATAVLIVRTMIYSYLHRAITSGLVEARRALLIGDIEDCRGVLNNLRRSGIRAVGVLPFPYIRGNTVPGAGVYSQTVRKLVDECRAQRPDDIVFLAEPHDLPRIGFIADALSELPVTVHVIPIGADDLWTSSKMADFGGTITIQILHPPLSAIDLVAKRTLDLVVASAALILLLPLLIMISAAIKLDSQGPVIFRQARHGFNNQKIKVLKFRSMSATEDGHCAKQAIKNDPRITDVGHIIRRTNLDELPQFFNVLFGDMSIVGPRPHPISLNEAFEKRISPFSRRHKVKPGITGWAQVNGFRGETDTVEKMQRRVEYDLHYIDNWSFILDLKIIVMTLFSRRAYLNAE